MKTQVVLVTGASSGIGCATAQLLAEAGYKVYGAARRIERMDSLKPFGVIPLSMDVTDEKSVSEGVQYLLQQEGSIDILINNAGYGSYGALEDVPLSEARYQFDVNIFGLARLCQLVLPSMRERQCGRIINISSMGGKFGEPNGAWYHATKYAVEGLSDCMRMELKQFGIDVVLIEPGAIITEWNSIARAHLLKVSGATAYGPLARKHVKLLAAADTYGSQPTVIAKTILRAVRAKRPATRYAAGAGAKLLLFMRAVLPDRVFDWLLLSQMK